MDDFQTTGHQAAERHRLLAAGTPADSPDLPPAPDPDDTRPRNRAEVRVGYHQLPRPFRKMLFGRVDRWKRIRP